MPRSRRPHAPARTPAPAPQLLPFLYGAVYDALYELHRSAHPVGETLTAYAQDNLWLVTLTVQPQPVQVPVPPPDRPGVPVLGEVRASAPPRLSPVERALMQAATDYPQTAKALARRANYTYGSHVRSAIAALCRLELLQKLPDGYRRCPDKRQ